MRMSVSGVFSRVISSMKNVLCSILVPASCLALLASRAVSRAVLDILYFGKPRTGCSKGEAWRMQGVHQRYKGSSEGAR
jgi:hypothetical protein